MNKQQEQESKSRTEKGAGGRWSAAGFFSLF